MPLTTNIREWRPRTLAGTLIATPPGKGRCPSRRTGHREQTTIRYQCRRRDHGDPDTGGAGAELHGELSEPPSVGASLSTTRSG